MSARYRDGLPQLAGGLFVTDGGLETTLVFHEGIDLPEFAAYDLLTRPGGRDRLRRYYAPYLQLAGEQHAGFVLETPTWRASEVWGERIGHNRADLERLNREAVTLMEELRAEAEGDGDGGIGPIVISGCIGPHDDGYTPSVLLDAADAGEYHAAQIATFADTAADMVSAITMTYVEEAIGIARAASVAGIPVAVSFTVETDGRLPSGQDLGEAIGEVDADSDSAVAYFMVNCAHPTHFADVFAQRAGWHSRIRGICANASTLSHAQLDEATELDDGDPDDLAARYLDLRGKLPELSVLGGCCGTDQRHVGAITRAWGESRA